MRVLEPGEEMSLRDAAGRHSEIAAVPVEACELRLYSPLRSCTGAMLGDVGEWLKPAVC